MSIQFNQPLYFLLLFAVPPALIFSLVRAKNITRMMRLFDSATGSDIKPVSNAGFRIRCRIVFWSLAWISAVIALAGPSWGTEPILVQKSGSAVCFVFDISYSMTATDMPKNTTLSRLDETKQLAHKVLSRLRGTAVAAVLAKGDGILAVPLTEDYNAIASLVNSLSPYMLSAPGSSLARGIKRAINSFPPQSARNSYIVVFTDGDETDDGLVQAVEEATRYGIQIIFAGFGSENGSEILAGDGKTVVKTALRAKKLKLIAENPLVTYVLASEPVSESLILDIIEPASLFFGDTASAGTSYELERVRRHNLFLQIALILFLFGFFVYSFTPKRLSFFTTGKGKALLLLFVIFPYMGCSSWTQKAGRALEGSYYWSQQDYKKSTAAFLELTTYAQAAGDRELLQYGLFGLSAGYIMQGEDDASLLKLNEMSPDIPPSLTFAHWYNKGIIFYEKGEYEIAAQCFKRALLADSTSLIAKINLELCLQNQTAKARSGRQELIPVAEQIAQPGAGDAIFSIIRENEEKRWKNQEVAPRQSDIVDY